MANALAITLHASGAESSNGATAAVDIGALRSCLKLRLDLSALSGASAKLAVTIETATSNAGPWRRVADFPALTVVASKECTFADCDRYVRARWTFSGTGPTATFAVSGEAHVLYCKISEIDDQSIPAKAIASVDVSTQAACCLSATDEADGYLNAGKTLPLTAWGGDLKMHVANIAAFHIMKNRGFQPQGFDELIVKGRDDAITWLRGVARGDIDPPGMIDSTPDTYDAGIVVVSGSSTRSGCWP